MSAAVKVFPVLYVLGSGDNQPLDTWNVNSGILIDGLFQYATSFNQPLNLCDHSNVDVFFEAFYDAESFNQPSDSWNIANRIRFFSMFNKATRYNKICVSGDQCKQA